MSVSYLLCLFLLESRANPFPLCHLNKTNSHEKEQLTKMVNDFWQTIAYISKNIGKSFQISFAISPTNTLWFYTNNLILNWLHKYN